MQIPNGTLSAAKETASKTMIDVLHSYRKNCSTQSSPGQLVLPEALKLAPLYHLSLSKCPAFRCRSYCTQCPSRREISVESNTDCVAAMQNCTGLAQDWHQACVVRLPSCDSVTMHATSRS